MRRIALIVLPLLLVAQAGHTYDEAMLRCAERGHWKCVFAELESRANPNQRSMYGFSALHYAAKEDHLAAIQALIAARADVNAQTTRGDTPAHFSAGAWDEDHVGLALLAEAGADLDAKNRSGRTPLDTALSKRHESAVRQLLKAGANPGDGNSRIIQAVQMSLPIVQAFVDAGAELPAKDTEDGRMLMHGASADVIPFLAERGFDPNARNQVTGRTPLESAASDRSAERILALMEAGAEPNKGLLRIAIKSGSTQPLAPAVLALLVAGLEPDTPDENGFTPLHHAALSLDERAVAVLLAHGANPVADDNDRDVTPLELMRMVEDQLAGRSEVMAEAGLLGLAFGRLRLHEFRRRGAPVIEMLEAAEDDWSFLDALKAKFN